MRNHASPGSNMFDESIMFCTSLLVELLISMLQTAVNKCSIQYILGLVNFTKTFDAEGKTISGSNMPIIYSEQL